MDPIARSLSRASHSKLKLFRFGTFRDSTINFFTVFKPIFGAMPNLLIGAISLNRKAGSDYIYTKGIVDSVLNRKTSQSSS